MKALSLVSGLFLFSIALNVNAAADPKQRTDDFVKAMIAAKPGDEQSYKRIDQYINYDAITSETIAPHRTKFSDAQAKEFKSNLTTLIRLVAYPQSGTFYKEAKYKYGEPKIQGNKAIVVQATYLPSEDLDMEIQYQWEKFNGNWMITDIGFDGDSMVKDYQNQFGRIISKDKVVGLLKKVNDKLAELKK